MKEDIIFSGLLIGALLSFASVLFAYRVDNSPLLNYLIGFSASLIIIVIFAFFVGTYSHKKQNGKPSKKRKMFILPIKSYISALFIHCAFIGCWQNENKKYTYNDFSNLFKKAFDSYCVYIEQIVDNNKNCELLNKLLEINIFN